MRIYYPKKSSGGGTYVSMQGRGVYSKQKITIPKQHNVATVQQVAKPLNEIKEDKPVMDEVINRLSKLNVKKKYINL